MSLIELKNINKCYSNGDKEISILENFNLTVNEGEMVAIKPGEIHGLIGENGSYICNELLGIEFTSEDGMKYAIENNLFSEICLKMVASATKILETKL